MHLHIWVCGLEKKGKALYICPATWPNLSVSCHFHFGCGSLYCGSHIVIEILGFILSANVADCILADDILLRYAFLGHKSHIDYIVLQPPLLDYAWKCQRLQHTCSMFMNGSCWTSNCEVFSLELGIGSTCHCGWRKSEPPSRRLVSCLWILHCKYSRPFSDKGWYAWNILSRGVQVWWNLTESQEHC